MNREAEDAMGPIPGVAVVGCGNWGANHVRNFSQLRALQVICDADEDTLHRQARLLPEVEATTDFGEVLGNDNVRGVVIAAPTPLHHSLAKRAILAGKDVFIEKPLALRYFEGTELVDLAESHGSVLMVGHILEYHPGFVQLNEVLRRGELGKVWYIYSNRLNLGQVRTEENALWSLAPHDISVITTIAGSEPVAVNASGGNFLQPGIADLTLVNMLFDGGLKAHIFVSWLHPYKERKLVVIGENKMAVFDDVASEGKLKIYDKRIEWQLGSPVPRQISESTLMVDGSEPMQLECQHFLDRIRDREQPLTGGENALRALRVLEASQMSLERGSEMVQLAEVSSEAPS